jgi:CSLREA domain-containing protein
MGRIPLALALGVLALAPSSAAAAIYPVNTGLDESDGTCVPAPGDCSLRDAVGLANMISGPDEIHLPPGDYELTLNTQLIITQAVDVVGVSGATPRNTTVRGNDMGTGERIFQVHANATLANFTVFNGKGKGAGTIDGGGHQTLRRQPRAPQHAARREHREQRGRGERRRDLPLRERHPGR